MQIDNHAGSSNDVLGIKDDGEKYFIKRSPRNSKLRLPPIAIMTDDEV